MSFVIQEIYGPEEWRPVVGFEDFYLVSSYGRLQSCRARGYGEPGRKGPWRELFPRLLTTRKISYLQAALWADGTIFSFKVHRLVYQAFVGPIPKNRIIDHIDRNPLNNHFSNLRLATYAQNKINLTNQNSGIYLNKKIGTFRTKIKVNGHQIHLGTFPTFEEAYEARRQAEIKYYGEFSNKVEGCCS